MTDPITQENLIVVEANNNSWAIHSSSEAKILRLDNTEIESTDINFGDYYIIDYNNRKSVMYCDYRFDETSKLYQVSGEGSFKFGSQTDCEIIYKNPYFKEYHFELIYKDGKWVVSANKSAFVYVNGGIEKHETVELSYGDRIYCYGLKIVVMKGLIIINNPKNCVTINSPVLKLISAQEKEVPYVEVKEEDYYKEEDFYFNTPRIRRFIDTYQLNIINPPGKSEEQEMPFLLVIGPMLTTAITSVITLGTAIVRIMSNKASFVSSLPQLIMGVSMLGATFLWPNLTKRWQKRQREKADTIRKEKYLAYLEDKKKEIIQETINQPTILKENLLPLSEYYETIVNKRRTLWERKISQRDFLTVRVGIGDIPIDMELSFSEEEFAIEKDPLKEVAVTMVDQAKMLHQVPIGYCFYNKAATAIMGKYEYTKPFADNVLLQLLACHSYDELKIVVFTNENNKSDWEVYKELPHMFSNDKSVRFFATNQEEAKEVASYLGQEFSKRAVDSHENEVVAKES